MEADHVAFTTSLANLEPSGRDNAIEPIDLGSGTSYHTACDKPICTQHIQRLSKWHAYAQIYVLHSLRLAKFVF